MQNSGRRVEQGHFMNPAVSSEGIHVSRGLWT